MRYKHFSRTERHELSILRKKGYSIRDIAREFGRSPSSVSRELRRNYSKIDSRYVAPKAQHKAYVRRKDSKYLGMKIRENPKIEEYIWKKIKPPFRWSPEQIAGRWNKDNPVEVHISPRVVYKYVYSIYGSPLTTFLKYKHHRRMKRRSRSKREMIPNRVWIDERPEEVNARAEFGHFEADTMGRPRDASLQTLAVIRERKSRKLFAVKVPRLKYTMEGFKDILSPYQDILGSVTFDNGVENVRYEELGVSGYFCHPYSSWEKGGVENGIGLIREYIPKKADLKDYTDKDIAHSLNTINNKPMKCLDWLTPNEVFNKELSLKVESNNNKVEFSFFSLLTSYQQCCT
jgi:transposase, IS30 family